MNRRRSPHGLQHFVITSAALLIGAAAAVVIYINLDELAEKVLGRIRRDDAVADIPRVGASPQPVRSDNLFKTAVPPENEAGPNKSALPPKSDLPQSVDTPNVVESPDRVRHPRTLAAPERIVRNGARAENSANQEETGMAKSGPPGATNSSAPRRVAQPVNDPTTKWFDGIKKIDDRRRALIRRTEPHLQELGELKKKRAETNAKLKPIANENKRIEQTKTQLEAEIAVRKQAIQLSNAPMQAILNTEITKLEADVRVVERRKQQLDALAAPLNAHLDELRPKIAQHEKELTEIARQGDRLAAECLAQLDPFAPISPEMATTATEFFHGLQQATDSIDAAFGHFGRGCILLRQGNHDGALLEFDKTLRLDPNQPLYLAVRGIVHRRLGNDVQARSDLKEAEKSAMERESWLVDYLYSLFLLKDGVYLAIEPRLKNAIKLSPEEVAPMRLMALIRSTWDVPGTKGVLNGKYAIDLAKQAYAKSKSWQCALALAAAHAELEQFDDARRHGEEAATLAENEAVGPERIAWCRECLKLFEEKKPLRIDWKTFDVWTKL